MVEANETLALVPQRGIERMPLELESSVRGRALLGIANIQGVHVDNAKAYTDILLETSECAGSLFRLAHETPENSVTAHNLSVERNVPTDYADKMVFIGTQIQPVAAALGQRLEEHFRATVEAPNAPFRGFTVPIVLGPSAHNRKDRRQIEDELHTQLGTLSNFDAYRFMNGISYDFGYNSAVVLRGGLHVLHDLLLDKSHAFNLAAQGIASEERQAAAHAHQGTFSVRHARDIGEIDEIESEALLTGLYEHLIVAVEAMYQAHQEGKFTLDGTAVPDNMVKLFLATPAMATGYRAAHEVHRNNLRLDAQLKEVLRSPVVTPPAVLENAPVPRQAKERVVMKTAEMAIDVAALQIEAQELAVQLTQLQGLYDISRKLLKANHLDAWRVLQGVTETERKLNVTGMIDTEAAQQIGILAKLRNQLKSQKPELPEDIELEALLLEQLSDINKKLTSLGKPGVNASPILGKHVDIIRNNWEEYRYILNEFPGAFTVQDIANLDAWFSAQMTDEASQLAVEEKLVPLTDESQPDIVEANHPSDVEELELSEAALARLIELGDFSAIAEGLDWVVLPPEPAERLTEALRAIYSGRSSSQISLERVKNLVWLRDSDLLTDTRMWLGAKGNLGMAKAYFVLEGKINDRKIAIAETALKEYATYLVCEDITPGSWKEILKLYKRQVLELGGRRINHNSEADHREKIVTRLLEMLMLQPL